jgi:arylsulfatase A-like enzyme
MPFFHMQSFGQSHESSLHFSKSVMEKQKTIHDPAKVKLAPYFPDTPTFRYTHARYLDRMQTIDQQIGGVVKNLKEDGLLEDTFVFYFGDHGGVLPRGKGYAYESGLHVPLVIRIPENFKHLVDHKRGTRTDGFVSFIDFGPTVLNLAGLKANPLSDGKAFLGKGTSANELTGRNETFGHADRFDEKYDLVRFLRKGKYSATCKVFIRMPCRTIIATVCLLSPSGGSSSSQVSSMRFRVSSINPARPSNSLTSKLILMKSRTLPTTQGTREH